MSDDIFKTLPARRGHFLLESGYHTDIWLSLDGLFVAPHALAPLVAALAELLRPYSISAVCGPLLGGAFLAQAVALQMGLRFYFSQPAPAKGEDAFFAAQYRLPPDLRRQAGKEQFAIVDDVISAGSSVRATAAELTAAGASTVVVGSLLILGNEAVDYFSAQGIPLVAPARQAFNLWPPAECPLCQVGAPLENPVALNY